MSREGLSHIRNLMRKLGWWSSREDVWHLVDTVDAQRAVIERLLDGWSVPVSPEDTYYGYWMHLHAEPQVMSRAEQIVVYDRVVLPEAPEWFDG